MQFDSVIRELGVEAPAHWRDGWDRRCEAFASQPLWLCEPGALDEAFRLAGISEKPAAALAEAWPALLADEHAMHLLRHCRQMILDAQQSGTLPPGPWPQLAPPRGLHARLFYVFVLLSAVREARELHERINVDEQISVDTFADIDRWMLHDFDRHGTWGFAHFGWLMNHFTSRLFALGRLQFELTTFPFAYHIYAHVNGKKFVAMPRDGERFQPSGLYHNADGNTGEDGLWTACHEADDERIVGHVVTQLGTVEREASVLEASEWRQALGQGDVALSVHIPSGARLDDAACEESFQRSAEFFAVHFPDRPVRGYFCFSWLMDPQLADHLPSEGSIVRFLKRFRILPMPMANDGQFWSRVFGGKPATLAEAPRDASLRRAVLQHIEAGGRWRMALGYIPRDGISGR